MWRPDDPQGNEAAKVRWDIVPYTRGQGLDLGCGPHKTFQHFTGVDSCKDTELFGIEMNPDVVISDCSDLSGYEDGSQDFVFSSHLLEHIEDHQAALNEWWRVIKVGGHLCLYLPHRDFYPNIGQPGSNPDHVHDFMPADIVEAMRRVQGGAWDLVVREERNSGMEYSFLLIFRKLAGNTCTHSHMTPKPKKTACVVRYGGFGDMIQASNVFPALKRQGYHVTVMTTPAGQDIVRHDPHVDAWIIQDKDQVPNHCLNDYWACWAAKFDKFIQLSESVEGTLLAMPGRANHGWPDAVRQKYLNRNYLEFTAELAGVPYASEARFYATNDELDEANGRLLHGGLNAMFALAGSSVHKFYPGQDNVIARLLTERPDCRVFLVGDPVCKILEAGWENEPRVVCLSGELGIRDTLALAQVCDLVIGPETGVLNAVAFEDNSKVCLLSHSSHENLTKHWRHAIAIAPNAPCYPCHRLHYTRDHCPEHAESGASICAASINPMDVADACLALLDEDVTA